MGQTVNLLVYTFGGSNPSSPTAFQAGFFGIPLFLFFDVFISDVTIGCQAATNEVV